ncbi:MAG: hypothetical protein SFX73_26365 [Kofleriaceae bacterium]|nr:hypothetical protein [Kofleriaceae bacterium]
MSTVDHTVTHLYGTSRVMGSSDTAPVTFGSIAGIAASSTALFVADSGNQTIRKIALSDGTTSTLAGTAGVGPAFVDSATAANVRFNGPRGLFFDGTSLFVADGGNERIRKVDPTSGGTTTAAPIGDRPTSVTGHGGLLYTTVSYLPSIRSVDPVTGNVTTMIESPDGSGATNGAGLVARLSSVRGMTRGAGDDLYLVDNGAVRKIAITRGPNGALSAEVSTGGRCLHRAVVITSNIRAMRSSVRLDIVRTCSPYTAVALAPGSLSCVR